MSAHRHPTTPPPQFRDSYFHRPSLCTKALNHRESTPTSIVLSLVASRVSVVSALPLIHSARSPSPDSTENCKQTRLSITNYVGFFILVLF